MLDQYQIQLTQYLEKEQYEDAKELLRFLLQCQGDERQHAIEWGNLLNWLEQAFPSTDIVDELDQAEDLEQQFRKAALGDYGSISSFQASEKLMSQLESGVPMEQQIVALERAEFIEAEGLDERLIQWLESSALHPALQFKALQTLKKRGASGTVTFTRLGEVVELEIEKTPLSMNEFPESVNAILDKAVMALEAIDVTMPILVTELWMECLQCLYGTRSYGWMLHEDEYIEDCFAAGLHTTIQLIVYGQAVEDDIREIYGITDEYRFRYEQASRIIRDITLYLQELS
ncbi:MULTISPECIES: hypothetical protein [Paenibacillus]|uniref:hypothetical protein n=1 Tax=Paenibacillus TaxID=44249 RepID=UPI00203C961D|nr:hypothetical protein [Paenibacillus camelliae]MCM3632473.1 hypothetical protein [Paenibacillus camelliae]